jgi:hypothetical protein
MPVTRRDVLDGGFHLLKPIDVRVVDPQLALELCQFVTVLFKRLMSTGITVVLQRRNGRLSAFPAFLKEAFITGMPMSNTATVGAVPAQIGHLTLFDAGKSGC